MSAYFIANITIHNQAEYQKYIERADGVFRKFNGRYLTVDDHPEVIEGEWPSARLVLIEFPDKASLKKWYDSDEYQEILQYRLSGARCNAVIVE
jgi:uncharacterized protein (DUF1330 family)